MYEQEPSESAGSKPAKIPRTEKVSASPVLVSVKEHDPSNKAVTEATVRDNKNERKKNEYENEIENKNEENEENEIKVVNSLDELINAASEDEGEIIEFKPGMERIDEIFGSSSDSSSSEEAGLEEEIVGEEGEGEREREGGEGEERDERVIDDIDQLNDLIPLLEEAHEVNEDELEDRVTVTPDFSQELVEFLVMNGTLLFISKYVLSNEVPLLDLFAGLGFPLHKDALDGVSGKVAHMLLQIAIRYAKKTRPRLRYPRTMDEIVDLINKSKNIIVVSGAGISTSLGIPDFRSDDGLYAQLAHLGLNDSQEVFDIRTFKMDPSIFYSVAKKILPDAIQCSGTPTHQFIKLLADKGKLLRNYTQNIDNLEVQVGIPHDKVVQCHGSFGSAHCVTCNYAVKDGTVLYPQIRNGEIPRCPQCKYKKVTGKRSRHGESDDEGHEDASFGVIKPDITFFGESLPSLFDQRLFEDGDAKNCDLLLCLGTSLRVSPVCEIVHVIGRNVPQVYISKSRITHLTFEIEFVGSCDDTVELLAQKLGWDLDHSMAKRPKGMHESEFPGGRIEASDGRFTFVEREE